MGTKRRMTRTLPATVCSDALADEVKRVADERGISKAELVRQAVEIFLHGERRKTALKTEKRI